MHAATSSPRCSRADAREARTPSAGRRHRRVFLRGRRGARRDGRPLRRAAAAAKSNAPPDLAGVTLAYVGSALATLYASVVMHSYFLTIVASIAQTVALLYYQVSYFPMGPRG